MLYRIKLLLILLCSMSAMAVTQKSYPVDASFEMQRQASSLPSSMQQVGDDVYFTSQGDFQWFEFIENYAYPNYAVWRLNTKTNQLQQVLPNVRQSIYDSGLHFVVHDGKIIYFDQNQLKFADLHGELLGTAGAFSQQEGFNASKGQPIRLNGYVYFSATKGNTTNPSLWRTNGTLAGTQEIPLCDGSVCYFDPRNLTQAGNRVFFTARNSNYEEAVISVDSTGAIKTFKSTYLMQGPLPYDTGVIIQASEGVWFLSGTSDSDYQIKSESSEFGAVEIASIGNKLVLASAELFIADNRGKGTPFRIKVGSIGFMGSPRELTVLNGKLYYVADIHEANGSLSVRLFELENLSQPKEIYNFGSGEDPKLKIVGAKGNKMLLFLHDRALGPLTQYPATVWVSDGTTAGTTQISEAATPSYYWDQFTWLWTERELLFAGYSPKTGFELWRSDATRDGTLLAKDIGYGLPDEHDGLLWADEHAIYYFIKHSQYVDEPHSSGFRWTTELWKTDAKSMQSTSLGSWPYGQVPSTTKVMQASNGLYFQLDTNVTEMDTLVFLNTATGQLTTIAANAAFCDRGGYPTTQSLGNRVFYQIRKQEDPQTCELWSSDGTVEGNNKLSALANAYLSTATAFNGTLYLATAPSVVNEQVNPAVLYQTDGTEAGTKPVLTLPSEGLNVVWINRIVSTSKGLFMVLLDNSSTRLTFWDQQSLHHVMDIPVYAAFAAFRTGLAFSVDEKVYYSEGTPGSTSLLLTLPAIRAEEPGYNHITTIDNRQNLLFTSRDEHGDIRLWRSDGTPAGTSVIGSALPGWGFYPHVQIKDDLYLTIEHMDADSNRVAELQRISLNTNEQVTLHSLRMDNGEQTLPVVSVGERVFFALKSFKQSFGRPLVTANLAEGDADGDGRLNSQDQFPLHPAEFADSDLDMVGDNADRDDDGDEIEDGLDAFPQDANEWRDQDHDGIGDNADTDDDNDGTPDWFDSYPTDKTKSSNSPVSTTPTPTPTPNPTPTPPPQESAGGGAISAYTLLGLGLLGVHRRRRTAK